MIVTVTPNPAWDVTYHLERLDRHGANRPASVGGRAGGKGINVTRVLRSLGVAVVAVAPLGGPTGERIRADLAAADIALTSVPVVGETRCTTTIVETASGGATSLNELGPSRTAEEWARVVAAAAELLPAASALVLSGSLPPGVPEGGYAELVTRARAAGVPVLLDASGPALLAGVAAGPDVVKPNADELRAATGESDPLRAVARLAARTGAGGAVVASFGPGGMLAASDAGWWRAVPPESVHGNATGAGDAAVAALARGLAEGVPWPERLRDAVALSAAAVAAPLAGDVDGELYRAWRPRVRVDAVAPPA
ncbi:1-phosphofructokinase family hexose kinase [Embleya sp. NPDC059237]|uniref:1-phosphofructokinase family hexose kinase n=1 Tax=Embleya sp. NPDC059237 TaxID=3346784 RepID=UPI00368C1515